MESLESLRNELKELITFITQPPADPPLPVPLTQEQLIEFQKWNGNLKVSLALKRKEVVEEAIELLQEADVWDRRASRLRKQAATLLGKRGRLE